MHFSHMFQQHPSQEDWPPQEVGEDRSQSVLGLYSLLHAESVGNFYWKNKRLFWLHFRHQQPGQLLHLFGRGRRFSRQAEGDVQVIGRIRAF